MGEKPDRRFCDPLQDSRNRITVRYHGCYGTSANLPPNPNDNGLGRTMFVMDTLHHEDGSLQGDEFQKHVDYSGRKSHHDGTDRVLPPIRAEFNDFGKKKEDRAIHVRSVDPQWTIQYRYENDQQVNSNVESRDDDAGNRMVQFECSRRIGRIQEIIPNLGPLLRIGTLEGTTWTKKNPKTSCRLVLSHSVVEESESAINTSMCNVQTCNESNGTNWPCRKSQLMVVDTVIKSNRNSVATSLGYELQGQGKDDDIDYMKKVLVCYIEEVRNYGFGHIIIIGGRYVGLLFMDCFGRVFDLDAMNSLLWFRGDYSKIVEREAKGLKKDWGVAWVFVESEGIVVETKSDDTPYNHFNFPVEKIKKKSKKKNSIKKRHH